MFAMCVATMELKECNWRDNVGRSVKGAVAVAVKGVELPGNGR